MGCFKSKRKTSKEPISLPSDIDDHPAIKQQEDTGQLEAYER